MLNSSKVINSVVPPVIRNIVKNILTLIFETQTKRILRKYKPKVVAVAGSVGKTSTKLFIATVLSQKYKVLAHQGSYNTSMTLPLAISNLQVPTQLLNPFGWLWLTIKIFFKYRFHYPYEAIVLELGTDRPGDIGYFMKYIKPTVGVVTAITPEHMEGFGTIETVLEEEFVLAQNSQVVLLNANDIMLNTKRKELHRISIKTFGVEKGDYCFNIEKQNLQGIKGQLNFPDKKKITVQLRVVASHNLYAVVAAAAAGESLLLSHKQIKQGMEMIEPVGGRMNILEGTNGSMIIDDSYNSSPDAAIAALDTLYSLPAKRKLAIIGSMNELGSYSKEGHENVGRWCAKLDHLVTIGEDARHLLIPAAIEAGLSKHRVESFDSPYEAGRFVRTKIKPGDLILIKGSQNKIFTEEAVKILLRNETDTERLVRQSPFWIKRKAQQFRVE